MRKTGVAVCLANVINCAATSRTCETLPGADSIRSLDDALRERRRDALVAYLVSTHKLRSADELYGLLLIDVAMSPTAMTARIKQACASVQLFVQRCLLQLEP